MNQHDTLQSRLEFERTWIHKAARRLTDALGSVGFLCFTFVFIFGWMALNLEWWGFEPFDPFPFILLTIIVPAAALVVSVIVLITQNREARIAEIRQQIDLEINVRTENEVTKILQMLDTLHREIGIARKDEELEEMKQSTDIAEIKEEIEEVLSGDQPKA